MMYILETSICWLFFYLLYFFFLKKETFFQLNRWYLTVTLLIGALLPVLELPETRIAAETAEIAETYWKPLSTRLQTIEVTATQGPVEEVGPSFETILKNIYFIGICVLMGRFVIGLLKLRLLYSESKKEYYEDFTLVITPKRHLPFSFFNCIFWSEHHELPLADKAKIIQHEKAHIQQRHSLDVMLVELLSIFLWCSPLIYFYKRSLRIVHEYLADAAVLKDNPIQLYGKLLLTQSMCGPSMVLANHFFQSPLKNRIIMMTKSKSSHQAMLKYTLVLPIILMLLLVFSSKNLMAQEQQPVLNQTETEEVFKVVEQMPVFPGCDDIEDWEERKACGQQNLLQFIFGKIKYPEEARKLGVEGVVLAKFVIEKDGSISRVRIIRSIGSGTDEEVRRVVNLMAEMPEKWSAGVHKGKNVAVEFVLPIKFKLADPTEEELKSKALAPPREALSLSNYVTSPNPTTGPLKIQFEAEKAPLSFQLLDINGKVLENKEIKNFNGTFQEEFDLTPVSKGTIIIKVSQNGKLYFNKVVVQ